MLKHLPNAPLDVSAVRYVLLHLEPITFVVWHCSLFDFGCDLSLQKASAETKGSAANCLQGRFATPTPGLPAPQRLNGTASAESAA